MFSNNIFVCESTITNLINIFYILRIIYIKRNVLFMRDNIIFQYIYHKILAVYK